MNKLYKTVTFLILLGIGLKMYSLCFSNTPYSLLSHDYFVSYGLLDTGAKNLLAGIYLNYRLFDTLFESTLLFVVTAGILYLGKQDSEVR